MIMEPDPVGQRPLGGHPGCVLLGLEAMAVRALPFKARMKRDQTVLLRTTRCDAPLFPPMASDGASVCLLLKAKWLS